ncbi:UDP-N-acetylglucosamine 1-carboxyvinyltransferase [Mobilitalea sibirica]|uniref:UDP-N-acetylglucosamine 1-carboxyvinyltransferase n=1 Tax=Mobilitalea sibirica TaxID=1462919 RepID=A0A8J7HEE2_9FIRM|nr:UDP-N-acetylglucosamine 1-carboxyvinyltransferase [Mobilitalea sibirica]MBH1941974.1 UDP-N-acetylglucosamine 1-carboxyvinyltransferase [Mobilitalea sibirica]
MATNESYLRVNGGKALKGEVEISGSKNSILALIPAMCLGDGEGVLTNAPVISDVDAMKGILGEIGIQLICNHSTVKIKGNIKYNVLSKQYVSQIRASNLFLGVLLAKFGKAVVPLSGGDKIGNRPIDIHLYVFEKFGIQSEVVDGYVKCKATHFPYQGQNIFLRFPSVGATENAMLVASAAEGETVIYNAAMEPEIVDMAILLNSMGVKITGAGTPVIRIKPSDKRLIRADHEVIPDRLEAGTFLFMLAATKGTGIIKNIIPEHLVSAITILSDSGVSIKTMENSLHIDARNCELKPIQIEALPFPGFPTDLQPFASVYALNCNGTSTIKDTIHSERFNHLHELSKMGMVNWSISSNTMIQGMQKLTGTSLNGTDIRMAVSLVMAALIAEGESRVYGLNHILRGYDNFVQKLNKLGAEVVIMDKEPYDIIVQMQCM